MTDTIPDWAGKRACELLNAEAHKDGFTPEWGWPKGEAFYPARTVAKLVMQHEQPPVDPELISMLCAGLKKAFKKADPDCSYHFDWADFGPSGTTDIGEVVVQSLARAVSQYKQEKANG